MSEAAKGLAALPVCSLIEAALPVDDLGCIGISLRRILRGRRGNRGKK